jgi:hypothetical protein
MVDSAVNMLAKNPEAPRAEHGDEVAPEHDGLEGA